MDLLEMHEAIPFSPTAKLSQNIGAADTIIPVDNVSAFPAGTGLATIGIDEEAETIRYATITDNALSGCERGIEGTAKAWPAGENIARNFTAKDWNDIKSNVEGLHTEVKELKESLDTSIEDANTAANSANTAAGEADTAAGNANNAADSANTAAGNANSAANAANKVANELQEAKENGVFNGATGKTAYQYATENGYAGTEVEFGIKLGKDIPSVAQGAGQSETLVMSQKAVTDLVAEALGTEETEYETVDSVDEMTDTSKSYVLSTTGTIWAYGEFAENVSVNDQIFDASKAFTGHMSGVNITSSSNKIYPLPVDMSQIPEDVEVWVEINGLYIRNTTSPYIEKIGYSALENPVQANSQIIESIYAGVGDADVGEDEIVATSNGCKVKVGYIKGAKLSAYDTIKTMLLEILSAQTHDASTITVYLQYEYNRTITKWYDTGYKPEDASGSGNYVDMLVRINQNTSDIVEVSNRVTALETGSDTVTIPSFWQDAVDICVSKIKALQVGRHCVTFPFFSDNHQRNGYAGVLIDYVMKECNIPYCFYGGDSISNGTIADEATMIEQKKKFYAMMSYIIKKLCIALGNHDGYWYDGTNKYYYDRNQIYELFLREGAIAQNKHFGEDGTYYYVDDIASKVRFIVLNTNGGSVDDTQIEWLQSTALSFNESGWGIVGISHQPISNHYHAGISNAADVVAVVVETATTKNVPIIGWFSGHIHRDIIATKLMTGGNGSNAGTEVSDLGFTQVIITSDHTGIAYDDATKHAVANDDKSHAIDFVTINKKTRTVNLTRLGIGEDRSYTY